MCRYFWIYCKMKLVICVEINISICLFCYLTILAFRHLYFNGTFQASFRNIVFFLSQILLLNITIGTWKITNRNIFPVFFIEVGTVSINSSAKKNNQMKTNTEAYIS